MIYTAGVLGLTEAAKSLKYGADRSANAFLEIVDRSEGATSGLLEKRGQSWIDGTIHSGVSKVVIANILYHAQKKKKTFTLVIDAYTTIRTLSEEDEDQ